MPRALDPPRAGQVLGTHRSIERPDDRDQPIQPQRPVGHRLTQRRIPGRQRSARTWCDGLLNRPRRAHHIPDRPRRLQGGALHELFRRPASVVRRHPLITQTRGTHFDLRRHLDQQRLTQPHDCGTRPPSSRAHPRHQADPRPRHPPPKTPSPPAHARPQREHSRGSQRVGSYPHSAEGLRHSELEISLKRPG